MKEKKPSKALSEVIFSKDLLPTCGINLVEASAGTGKTYSIQSLYLRFLLEQGLTINQILLVTFTEAACKELRERIRSILHKAMLALEDRLDSRDGDHARIEEVFKLLSEQRSQGRGEELDWKSISRSRLSQALTEFDNAAIHTIHGLCARILAELAFECGELFDREITADAKDLLERICKDHYMREVLEDPFKYTLYSKNDLNEAFLLLLGKEVSSRIDALIHPKQVSAIDGKKLKASFHSLLNSWEQCGNSVKESFQEALNQKFFKSKFSTSLENAFSTLDEAKSKEPPFSGLVISELLDSLELFSTTEFEANKDKRKKKAKTWKPSSREVLDFCQKCEDLLGNSRAWALKQKVAFANQIRRDFQREKESERIFTYDDLLIHLRAALEREQSSSFLLERLEQRYRLAVIDEFQDTDPIQWEIFYRVFQESRLPVYLVGDPKQAIYAFRNGDIYTYFDAASKAEERYTLEKNYRSEEMLVEGVNSLFEQSSKKAPFVDDRITMPRVKARGLGESESLLIDGRVDETPLKIRFIDDEKVLKKDKARMLISSDIANEIISLLNDRSLVLKERPLRPSDFCILVTKHHQGEILRRELSSRGLPTVLQRSGNVFCKSGKAYGSLCFRLESIAMLQILHAIAQPRRDQMIRTALASVLFPYKASSIWNVFVEGDRDLERNEILEIFSKAKPILLGGSFVAAFELLDNHFGIRRHLLSLPDGDRLMTNVLHQVELIQEKLSKEQLGINSLIAWYKGLIHSEENMKKEEQEIRLETDAKAIQVMTVFKSKGLEFPIVFLPFMWDSELKAPRKYYRYHKKTKGSHKLVIDLDTKAAKDSMEIQKEEILAEKLRILYVALTRASHRNYLYWGKINRSKETGLNYLLHLDWDKKGDSKERSVRHLPSEKQRSFEDLNSKFQHKKGLLLQTLEAGKEEKPWKSKDLKGPKPSLTRLHWPERRKIPSPARISSFSSLLSEQFEDFDIADKLDELSPTERASSSYDDDLMDFPAGARTGTAWHEIFETVDFSAKARDLRNVVESVLERYRLLSRKEMNSDTREGRITTVTNMVETVLETPLSREPSSPVLKDIDSEDRISEMAFDFTCTPQASMADVNQSLRQDWPDWNRLGSGFADREREIEAQFMTGYIDLVFRVNGKYHILDWKSNRPRLEENQAFDYPVLEQEMIRHGYALQLTIYTLALHLHLKRVLHSYDYDTHFAGVYYVFLRGVCKSCPGSGIYFARPPKSAIESLSRVLRKE